MPILDLKMAILDLNMSNLVFPGWWRVKRIKKKSLSRLCMYLLYIYIYTYIYIYLWQGPFCIIRVVHLPSNSEKWRFTSYSLPFIWDGKGKYCLNHQPIWSAPFDWSTGLPKFSEFKLHSIKFRLRKWTFLPLEFESIHNFQGPKRFLSPTNRHSFCFRCFQIPPLWPVFGDHFNLLLIGWTKFAARGETHQMTNQAAVHQVSILMSNHPSQRLWFLWFLLGPQNEQGTLGKAGNSSEIHETPH